ncbi:MAG TPA: serine hydroxymethyltransferase [Verrucomicrobiae bacterium]|nr:serine hydroxymethyltransferase [Verrucomicrobiae bacterium]
MSDREDAGEVFFEIMRIGDVQRVAAIDAATGVEVVIQAPANASLVDVRALALRKLERALSGDGDEEGAPPPTRPGKLV